MERENKIFPVGKVNLPPFTSKLPITKTKVKTKSETETLESNKKSKHELEIENELLKLQKDNDSKMILHLSKQIILKDLLINDLMSKIEDNSFYNSVFNYSHCDKEINFNFSKE
jgi:hypothetical protein